jgi:hypothetical protein
VTVFANRPTFCGDERGDGLSVVEGWRGTNRPQVVVQEVDPSSHVTSEEPDTVHIADSGNPVS